MVVNVPALDNTRLSSWKNTVGRVAFMNCDPLFLQLSNKWHVLSAPPSWLTGHLIRRDCIIAPIPAADYAKNTDELALLLILESAQEVKLVVFYSLGPRVLRKWNPFRFI